MKALAIDGALSDAHAALAVVCAARLGLEDGRRRGAQGDHAEPRLLDSPYVLQQHAALPRPGEESIAQAKRAVELDPLAVLTNQVLADAYLSGRRYDLAIAQCQSALDLHPEESSLHHILGWAYVYQGNYDSGIQSITKSHTLDGIDAEFSPDLAYIDAVTGKTEGARRSWRACWLSPNWRRGPSPDRTRSYGTRPNAGCSAHFSEQAYRQHSAMMTWLKVDARFDKIRQEPRFQNLMRGVGLI